MPEFPTDFATSTLSTTGILITYLSSPLALILGVLLALAVVAVIIRMFIH